MINYEFGSSFISIFRGGSANRGGAAGWIVSVQIILDILAEDEALPEGKANLVEVQMVIVDELFLIIIRVIFDWRALLAEAVDVEVKCDQDATKLDVVLADGHRCARRGNPGL